MVMEAKLPNLPKDSEDVEIDYDAQFNDRDVRNGIVTCAALSLDGHHVALGFGSGVIELANIDHQCTISRFQLDRSNHPVWIEFVHGSHRVAVEDNEGNVTILSHDMAPVNIGTLPNNPLPAVTRVSDNGLFIIRVPQNTDRSWYDSMTLISISGDLHMQHLAPPSSNNFTPTSNPPIHSSAAGRTPLFGTVGPAGLPVFFDGKLEFIIPKEYCPVVFSGAEGSGVWYGERVPSDPTYLYSPRSSKDGTRILSQGRQTAPIVVDLSQVL
ncbi:uncharacterized protein EI90DRAFT_3058827 [Cantharellus anzutake]|uniref:uncharacterized protein n=1 Tax=Cantharellus anzutake TaxID=1750568 RepID=UPI00190558D2|nr:uncharacterized protein EI90DRAFT_3058827 [Cantharellus anzutake]KAF8330696.1 hypothetical protein EI90DRAFT_3058827 [Cantharellus anzutake]